MKSFSIVDVRKKTIYVSLRRLYKNFKVSKSNACIYYSKCSRVFLQWSQMSENESPQLRETRALSSGGCLDVHPTHGNKRPPSRRAVTVTHHNPLLWLSLCSLLPVLPLRDRRAVWAKEEEEEVTEGTWWWCSLPIGVHECVHLSRLAVCEMTE